MTVQELLNKFTNDDFILTVDGWCDELPFSEYEEEKKQEYWNKYKNAKVESLAILKTNEKPELYIKIKSEKAE